MIETIGKSRKNAFQLNKNSSILSFTSKSRLIYTSQSSAKWGKAEGAKRPIPFFAYRQKSLFVPGCVQGASVCQSVCVSVSVCVCVTFVVFTDCESCTRQISTKPGSMETGEYMLTSGTCSFVARHLEMVAVAGLLKISCVCFRWGEIFSCFFGKNIIFFVRTHTACCM